MKKIVLTGGGTAGHVTPNIALLPALREKGYEIYYAGGKEGIERELAEKAGLEYFGVSSGKLRRYMSLKNFTDIFRVVKGLSDASSIIKRIKPDVVFSKGGFVAVPVVMAAGMSGVPVVVHESDMSPGLANRLSMPFSKKVCATFPETMKSLSSRKAVLTGTPIRKELFSGSKIKGRKLCGFIGGKPVLLLMGGSLGSAVLNRALREALPELMGRFDIIHLCGRGNKDGVLEASGYVQFEYVSGEMPDILAAADVVISRAGSNSICELLSLKKPNLLVPLTKKASRGDQILNAESFKNQGFSMVLPEEELSRDSLLQNADQLYAGRGKFISAMEKSPLADGVAKVVEVIEAAGKGE